MLFRSLPLSEKVMQHDRQLETLHKAEADRVLAEQALAVKNENRRGLLKKALIGLVIATGGVFCQRLGAWVIALFEKT